MTTTLIVLAHPERRSFNGAWAEATARASEELGHTVQWSDLGLMGFDPAESVRHYPNFGTEVPFDPLKAQEKASEDDGLSMDVSEEIAKLRSADRVIFHFPLWWFAPPAVLKGWFDRVLVHGATHTIDERFDSGRFHGKRALFCVTAGASEAECSFSGKEGDIRMLLWPAAYTLRYLGFSVLAPEVLCGVHGYYLGEELSNLRKRLKAALDNQHRLVEEFDARPLLPFNPDSDFDSEGRLRPESPSHSPFIRHRL